MSLFYRLRRYRDRLPRPAFVAVLALLAAVGAGVRYVRKTVGSEFVVHDIETVWRPLAFAVFDGADLYADVWDNKPPLWEFLNLGIAALPGEYVPVSLVVMAVANTAAAVLIYILCIDETGVGERVARLAPVVFLAVLPVIHGYQINPRQVANIALLGALIATDPVVVGIAVASAGLLTQFSVLVLPVVCWRRWRRHGPLREDLRWYATMAGAGLALAVAAYALVGLVWGFDALVAGVRSSLLPLSEYAARKADESLWNRPVWWLMMIGRDARALSLFVMLTVAGALASVAPPVRRSAGDDASVRADGASRDRGRSLYRQLLALVALVAVQSLIRPSSGIYYVAYAPFMAIIAAFGALRIADGP